MRIYLTIFNLFFVLSLYPQTYDKLDASAELCLQIQGKNFISNIEAENLLEKILSTIGASKRFILKPCNNINNAVAVSYKGIRYILYDKEFMNNISKDSNNWGDLFILAHEVAHHINGHSLDMVLYAADAVERISLSENREQELEADEFAGFIIGKLGGPIEEINKLISKFSNNSDDTYKTHPSRNKRLKAAQNGYNNAANELDVYQQLELTKLGFEEYIYLGIDEYEKGIYGSSISNLSQAIKINPKSDEAFLFRGKAYFELEQYNKALNDLNKAISLNSISYYYIDRARIKHKTNDRRSELLDLRIALKMFSNKFYNGDHFFKDDVSITLLKIANSEYHLGNFNEAIDNLNEALKINPNYFKALSLRGTYYSIENKFKLAISDIEKAVDIYENLDDGDPVKNDYSRGIDLLILGLAELYYNSGRKKTAFRYIDKVISNYPNFSINAYSTRANLKHVEEDYYGAYLDFKKAIEMDSKNSTDFLGAAISGYMSGEVSEYELCNFAKKAKSIGLDSNSAEYANTIINATCY